MSEASKRTRTRAWYDSADRKLDNAVLAIMVDEDEIRARIAAIEERLGASPKRDDARVPEEGSAAESPAAPPAALVERMAEAWTGAVWRSDSGNGEEIRREAARAALAVAAEALLREPTDDDVMQFLGPLGPDHAQHVRARLRDFLARRRESAR